MKKNYIILLIALLTFVGMGMAWATLVPDSNPEENSLTSIHDGDRFFLRASLRNADGTTFVDNEGYPTSRWITLHTPYAPGEEWLETVSDDGSTINDAGLFVAESAGISIQLDDITFEGFYLKNVKSDMYIYELEAERNAHLGLTANQSEALVWGFRPLTDYEQFRDNELLQNKFFVFTQTASGISFLNGGTWLYEGKDIPYYGTWTDGPAWFDLIPPVDAESDYVQEHISLYKKAATYGSIDENGHYIIYGGIGGYADDLVQEYNTLMYDNTDDLLMKENKGETVDWPTLIAQLEALILKMESAEIIYPTEGYYRFLNGHPAWRNESDQRAVYSQNNLLYWMTYADFENDPSFIWHITRKEDGSYRIQSLSDGLLLTNCPGRSQQMSLSTNEDLCCWLVSVGKGQFNIRVGVNDGDHDVHPAGHQSGAGTEGTIVGWASGADDFSAWYLVQAKEEEYAPYVAAMEQKLADAKAQSNFPPKDGYYRIISTYTQWIEEGHFRAVYSEGKSVKWRKYLPEFEDDPEFIWRFTRNEDGTYRIQNLYEGLFLSVCDGQSADMQLSINEEPAAHLFDLGMGQMNISISSDGNSSCFIHPKGHDNGNGEIGTICGFPGGMNSQSSWRLVPASEEEYAPYVAAMEEKLSNLRQIEVVQGELLAKIKEVGDATKSAFEYELPSTAVEVTPTSAFDFWSNAAMLGGAPEEEQHGMSWGTDGQGYGALIDDNLDTWFHTYYGNDGLTRITWSAYNEDGTPAEGATPSTLHNLAMKLTQPVTNVTFQLSPRGNNVYNNPCKVDLDVSEDGIHWTTVFYGYDFFKPTTTPQQSYLMGPFDLGGSYQYVRFANYINDRSAHYGLRFFCFSELKVFEGAKLAVGCQASTMDQSIVNNLLKAYSEANRYADIVTADQLDDMRTATSNLQAAYEAFNGEFADPSELELATVMASKIMNNYTTGNGYIGEYDGSIGKEDLFMVFFDALDLLSDGGYTKEQLAEATKAIYDEIDRLEATRILPDPDKWYKFVFPSQDEFYENPGWNNTDAEHLVVDGDMSLALYDRVAAVMADAQTPFEDISEKRESDNLRLWNVHEDLIRENPEVSYFRFVPVSEGKYALQNMATGLYVCNLTHGGQVIMSSTPGIFTLSFVGKGCTILLASDYWTGTDSGQSLHFTWNSGYAVCGWTDTEIGTKSSLHICMVDEAEDATLYLTGKQGVAQARTLLTDINSIDGATLYEPTAICVDKETNPEQPAYFLALEPMKVEEVEEGQPLVPAGTPFIIIPDEEEVIFYLGTGLTKEVNSNGVLNGILQARALETDEAYLTYDTNENTNYLQVVGGNIKYNASAFSAFLDAMAFGNLPTSENTSDFDILIPMRNTANLTGIIGVESMHNAQCTMHNAIYDLTGRKVSVNSVPSVTSVLPKGIYIVNGRKVLIQ